MIYDPTRFMTDEQIKQAEEAKLNTENETLTIDVEDNTNQKQA